MISVRVKWNSISCQRACYERLLPRLQAIPGVDHVEFNSAYGEAKLFWRPDKPFDLNAVVTVLRLYAGARTLDMGVEVRGTIYHSGNQVFLVSSGDNLRYLLLGQVPAQDSSNRWHMERSIFNRPLDPVLLVRLMEAETNNEIVTINGLLTRISSRELFLIILNVKYTTVAKKK